MSNNFNYNKLTPFKWFVLENFPFIEADFDALTNWQLFCKLGKEINVIINSENTLGTQLEEVTTAFNNLQNYVNNYFKNLDVQDEIDNKLNEMAEDGTLEKIIENYITQLNYIRVSDYYKENEYIDLQNIYDIAKQNKKNIFIDGIYKTNTTMICDEYIEIFGGKIIADSYDTTTDTIIPKDIIILQNGGYIHDITLESNADRIPYINKRVGEMYGYASNINAIKCTSNNCTIERVNTKFMTGVWLLGSSGNELNNINIDKCLFDYAEMGIYAQLSSFNLTNSDVFMSEDVQSIYYHPLYAIIINNSNLSNLNIKTNTLINQTVELQKYYINDVFHIYNPTEETITFSENINISNINIKGHFNILSQLYYNKSVFYNNIRGTFKKGLFLLRKNIQNVNVTNSDFTFDLTNSRMIDFTREFNSTDNLKLSNCKFTFNNSCSQIIGSCNIEFINCRFIQTQITQMIIPYDKSICNGYLKLINCYMDIYNYSTFYLGSGEILYKDCYFKNNYMNPSGDTGISATSKCKLINCYFESLRNIWDTQYQSKDLFFNVYGWDTSTNKQKYITSIPTS